MILLMLYEAFHPVIDVLGTLGLITIICSATLIAIGWVILRTWKIIVAAGVVSMILMILQLALMVP